MKNTSHSPEKIPEPLPNTPAIIPQGNSPTWIDKFSLGKLKPQHRSIARAFVMGIPAHQIAKLFGLTPEWISDLEKMPLFRAEMARLEQGAEASMNELGGELKELSVRAMEVVAEELHIPERSKERTDSAFKVLDRTGYYPKADPNIVNNKNLTIINLIPEPGSDPVDSLKKINEAAEILELNKIEEIENND